MHQATLGDRYRLLDTLGGGGMAKVYLAHDEVLDREVALKVLREQFADDGEFVERFRREARSAASLRHPNIVQVYDQGRAGDGSHYMAMEYVSGGTLKDEILARGRLEPPEAAAVALRVAEALEAAHAKGVIHRDIKPQNVLLDNAGEPKVADFGIARAASAATISQTSHVLGTAGYMSPEQALGKRAGPRSDLYSLGVVLYEMLVGALPYEADTPVAVAVKHINEPPRPPDEENGEVPASLAAITLKLLAKDPEHRYPDASTLAEDLRRVLDGLPPAEVEPGFVPPVAARSPDDSPTVAFAAGKKRRGWLRPAVAALAGLMLLGGVVLAAREAPWEETGETADPVAEQQAGPPEVPEVVGLSEAAARERLSGAGFEVEARGQESNAAREGAVLDQSVAGGERAEKGSTVEISVGEGPTLVETPDLASEADAAARLEQANLTLGEVSYSASEAAAGAVISQSPAAGEEVEEGTAVDIVVSTGPEVVTPTPAEPVEPVQPAQPVVPVEPEPAEPRLERPEEAEPEQPEPEQPEPEQIEPVPPRVPAQPQVPQTPNTGEVIENVYGDLEAER